MRRLRILGFHGYHGSGAVLRRQLAPLAERLSDLAEFETPDAPSIAEGDFGWWHGTFPSSRTRFSGWSITAAWLEALPLERFDGVFGFSQGAALVGLLTGMREGPGFAVMASGFVSLEPEHRPLYQAVSRSRIPSLHLIGASDSIVAAKINIEWVLGNKLLVSSVNGNRRHFELGMQALSHGELTYPGVTGQILTHPVSGLDSYKKMMQLLEEKEALKVYVNVAE